MYSEGVSGVGAKCEGSGMMSNVAMIYFTSGVDGMVLWQKLDHCPD